MEKIVGFGFVYQRLLFLVGQYQDRRHLAPGANSVFALCNELYRDDCEPSMQVSLDGSGSACYAYCHQFAKLTTFKSSPWIFGRGNKHTIAC
jgi:hypothetical protein